MAYHITVFTYTPISGDYTFSCSQYFAQDFAITYDNTDLQGYENLNMDYVYVQVGLSDEVGNECATLAADHATFTEADFHQGDVFNLYHGKGAEDPMTAPCFGKAFIVGRDAEGAISSPLKFEIYTDGASTLITFGLLSASQQFLGSELLKILLQV
eukprot:CAMPEP_0202961170 /NCGR_PEP_ID=MMETSP1396-20130829/5227_1 /ASSEMBLY_ACC=CAM_ASM_000872 /TAXON_ID= /ORGANISM="Pseudokeronopsis sp., Strain Brazil" /LENGTH=155 /DNA_ID=CAMNT_0049680789 /DNA_START=193 /DNA_END=658 /DNA_ORIENTATION=-